MTTPNLSQAALDALAKLAEKPGSAIDKATYDELLALNFAMGRADKAHITQGGKAFWLDRVGMQSS